ncbi:copper resistance D family protein [Virgibacillus sp. DJP39]|uniref:copper resistance D family protein n=1 Tax=Virgibacillus sp. DJP39 TaxID=3409790 RepID=UPI003BB48E92
MTVLVSLTEFILYTCFSVLIGALILLLVPENKRPSLHIPRKVLFLVTGLIPLAALLPVIKTAEILSGSNGFWFVFKSVLFSFEVGKSWLFIALVATILIRVLLSKELKTNKNITIFALILTALMLVGYTSSSHAATITEWQGFLYHTLHFLAVSIWIGLLLVVSWFAKNTDNWIAFLKWFTPVAIACLIVALISGLFTMTIDINSYDDPAASILKEYQNSLMFNYGQALLIKHVLIIALIIFALVNGILFRKRSKQPAFNPLKWARLESVFALIVFGVTAFMGQSWPPHEIFNLMKTHGASPLFNAIYSGDIVSHIQNATKETSALYHVTFSFGLESSLLFLLGLLFLVITIFAAVKRQSIFVSAISSLLMVLALYIGIMVGIN